MNILTLDCSAGMKIYLQTDKGEFSKIDAGVKKHTDELLLSVDLLLDEAGIKIKDVDVIAVCVGPGSFTGVRVAISICKGLAIGTGAKVVEISNFDVFSYGKTGDAFYVLEGFSDFVYLRKIVGDDVIDECVSIDDLVEIIRQNLSCKIYSENEKVQKILNNNEITSVLCQNMIKDCVKLKIEKEEYIDIQKLSPVYLRASQAEIERNKKLGLG